MPSRHEAFWNFDSYAVVGHSARKPFPKLSYAALKARGKTVHPVDPSTDQIEGDATSPDLRGLSVEAVVLEVPKDETGDWMARVAEAGIKNVWIHMGRETAEALSLAADKGIQVCTGTCAVQYLRNGFPHSVHRILRKLSGRW